MNIYVVTLTLNYDDQLFKTIGSILESSRLNQNFCFEHIIVSPSNDFRNNQFLLSLNKIKNYHIQYIIDKKKGIYNAFNDAINAITSDGYIIFLSAGDVFKKNLVLNFESFNKEYEIIAMGVELIQKATSRPYYPKLRALPVNTIPHPGMFTKVSTLKRAGGFPTDLGTAADFYVTQKLILQKVKIQIEPKIVSLFYLGGASSRFESVLSYYKALKRLHYGMFTISICMLIKIYSYVKYAFQ